MRKSWKSFFAIVLSASFLFSSGVGAKSKVSTTTWKESTAPNYVVKTGKAKVTTKVKAGQVKYSKLDKYGRTKSVTARVTYDMVKASAGWRESIPKSEDPAGWGYNKKVAIKLYNGRTYHGYLYNRSHLLADSLGGKAIRQNLITGTRMQNVGANDSKGGMAYTERKTVDYLYKHPKTNAYYKATPVYKGKELLPRSVIVNVKTSDGGINERVVVYNAAKGFKIDYKTGNWSGSRKASTKKNTTKKIKKKKSSNSNQSTTVYVTATGKKYHSTKSCRGLSRAKSVSSESLGDAETSGLTPCSLCY